ncbi:MAG: tyrosine-type recombinase/integrase [Eubacteriales bacterium]|nr:tyrosine-type recombinase/integrase [Eubacteriales bacterium]
MARYEVGLQVEKHKKYYFIREIESCAIVQLPSKYLMHKMRSNISPNTNRRSAFAISYYLNYMEKCELKLEDVFQMKYSKQHEHFTDFLLWLKTGEHSIEKYKKLPSNETCNAYLKEVFQFYTFIDREEEYGQGLKVLSDGQFIVRDSVGVRRTLNRKHFHGYLKENGHIGKTIEQDKIVTLLQACTNCRDQVLLLLLAETGFRIGELLGIRYEHDIDYENHYLIVNFRDDNENGARAKNAEFRKAKVSQDTFDILMAYFRQYEDLITGQEYLFVNIAGDYKGEPFRLSGVYSMLKCLEKKTGIKASPHMLRHYFANTRRKAGWKLELLSQALGHRHIETTMRYLNITEEELTDASDEFYRVHQGIYGVQELL